MIVVKVELWSARTGHKTELARMHICNDETGSAELRNYLVRALRGRSTEQLDRNQVQREGAVRSWPAERFHIWNLVGAALASCGYGGPAARRAG